MKIAVFGCGYVGLTTALAFCELKHQVVNVDTDARKVKQLQEGHLPIYEQGMDKVLHQHLQEGNIQFTTEAQQAIQTNPIIYVAVGTPSGEDGSTDLTYVQEVARTIGQYQNENKIIVTKSTVPVGTGEKVEQWIRESQQYSYKVDIVSNPEFLREGSALNDALQPDRIIIGAENGDAANVIEQLYADIDCPKLITSLRTAELTKYSANAFLALKISYINEIGRLCDVYGVQVEDVARGMGTDRRIGPHFLRAGIGWGGSCFPKDTASLLHMFQQAHIQPHVVQAAREVNDTQIDYFVHKLTEKLGGVQGKTISILGLTFKPNTDDIRESPALKVIHSLHGQGANLKVYDPVAVERVHLTLPRVRKCTEIKELFEQSDAAFLLTEWREFQDLDWKEVYKKMRNPLVVDGRNALDAHSLRQIGFHYYGMGR